MYMLVLFVVIGLEFYLVIGVIVMLDVVKSMFDMLFGVLIMMVIGLKEYFFGLLLWVDKQVDCIMQFVVLLDIIVMGGLVDLKVIVLVLIEYWML